MNQHQHIIRNSYANHVAPYTPQPRKSLNMTQRSYTDPSCLLGQILDGSYRISGIVGSGPYSVVYNAFHLQSAEMVAIKMIAKGGKIADSLNQEHPRPRSMLGESIKYIDAKPIPLEKLQKYYRNLLQCKRFDTRNPLHVAYREVALHSSAYDNVPGGVVPIRQVLDSSQFLYMVMDFFPGDLFHAITDLKQYSDNDIRAKNVFLQIVDSVLGCHKNSIFHCDLKPENFLVNNDGSVVKLTDFGLSTCSEICYDYGCGSSLYMSPERQHRPASEQAGFSSAQCDSWALGVILLNVTCGRNPWKIASLDDSSYQAFLKDNRFLERILPISPELGEILARVFDVNPDCRPTLLEFRELVRVCPQLTRPCSPKNITTTSSPAKPGSRKIPSGSTVCSTMSANSYYVPGSPVHLQMSPFVYTRMDSPMLGVSWTPQTHQHYDKHTFSYVSPGLHNEGFESPLFNNGEFFRPTSPYKASNLSSSAMLVSSSSSGTSNHNSTGLLPALPLKQHGYNSSHHNGHFGSSSNPLVHPYSRVPRTSGRPSSLVSPVSRLA